MTHDNLYEMQRKLVPEIEEMVKKRYRILQAIALHQPVGRRTLANILQLTERDVRSETQLLQEQQLILIETKGMTCTPLGQTALEQLKALFHDITGIAKKEEKLRAALKINEVVIVPGNISDDVSTYSLLGKEAATRLMQKATNNSTIAVTGGSSVSSLGEFLQPTKVMESVQFIAARGSIGDEMTLQANTLVAKFAEQCHASYRTLYLPEHLSEQAYSAMKEEPIVKEMIDLYNEVDIVIHGIGDALEMASRRQSSQEDIDVLVAKGAVGEAFGYYFNEEGQIVHHIRTIGIQLEQVHESDCVIAIAAGPQKVKAIEAYFKDPLEKTIFITDEKTANQILTSL